MVEVILQGEAEGAGLVKHGREMTLGCIQWQTSLMYVEAKEKVETDITAVHGGKMRGSGHSLKQEIQTGYEEKLFPHEDSEVLEQIPVAVVQSTALEGFKTKISYLV